MGGTTLQADILAQWFEMCFCYFFCFQRYVTMVISEILLGVMQPERKPVLTWCILAVFQGPVWCLLCTLRQSPRCLDPRGGPSSSSSCSFLSEWTALYVKHLIACTYQVRLVPVRLILISGLIMLVHKRKCNTSKMFLKNVVVYI